MDKKAQLCFKAQQYWMDHELYRFVKSSARYSQNKNAIIGTVDHNGWKFSVVNNGTIRYITPTGEKGFFIDC